MRWKDLTESHKKTAIYTDLTQSLKRQKPDRIAGSKFNKGNVLGGRRYRAGQSEQDHIKQVETNVSNPVDVRSQSQIDPEVAMLLRNFPTSVEDIKRTVLAKTDAVECRSASVHGGEAHGSKRRTIRQILNDFTEDYATNKSHS